jgi:hypothetical protein
MEKQDEEEKRNPTMEHLLSSGPWSPVLADTIQGCFSVIDEEIRAEKGQGTCPRPHRDSMRESGFKLTPVSLQLPKNLFLLLLHPKVD